MRLRAGAFALAIAAVAQPGGAAALAAQTIRGQLVDSVSRAPLSGAFLTLVDSSGSERARAITDVAGQFTLSAPEPGTYRLRSKRIGFRPYFSPALALHSGETRTYNAAVDPIPIALREVVVAGERQCDVEAGASVAALWEEVRVLVPDQSFRPGGGRQRKTPPTGFHLDRDRVSADSVPECARQ